MEDLVGCTIQDASHQLRPHRCPSLESANESVVAQQEFQEAHLADLMAVSEAQRQNSQTGSWIWIEIWTRALQPKELAEAAEEQEAPQEQSKP